MYEALSCLGERDITYAMFKVYPSFYINMFYRHPFNCSLRMFQNVDIMPLYGYLLNVKLFGWLQLYGC